MIAASVDDFRNIARRRLPAFLFEYIDGGSYAQTTLARNTADLQAIALRQHVMRDVSHLDLSTCLFGQTLAMPVVLGPVGLAGLYAQRGEVQAANAAHAAGVGFCLSTVSVCPIAEVAQGLRPPAGDPNGAQPIWFQLYMLRDRGFVAGMLEKARAAGCTTLVFTVDLPVAGARYRDVHSGLSGGSGVRNRARMLAQMLTHPAWALDVGFGGRPHTLGNVAPMLRDGAVLGEFMAWLSANMDASVTWADIAWVRAQWPGALVIKGVLTADDARAACDAGADGIVVSNHGGRQLDGVQSTARVLPGIADAVADRLVVLADSGVRSGLDVVRLLALGARGVLLGRAWAFALAAGGQAGVAQMLAILQAEMRVAMALTGCTSIAAINRDILDRG